MLTNLHLAKNSELCTFAGLGENRYLMTSLTTQVEVTAALKHASPPLVSDSGVSNGSSLCLSESGTLPSEQAMLSPPSSITTAGIDGSNLTSTNLLCVRVEGVSLSRVSLEVCASVDNLDMITQDDLCGSDGENGSGHGSVSSVEGVDGVPSIMLDQGGEEIVTLQSSGDVPVCMDAGKGTYFPGSVLLPP